MAYYPFACSEDVCYLGYRAVYTFFPARTCSSDQVKLISAQQNDSMQEPNSGVALVWNWDKAKAINVRVADKNFNISQVVNFFRLSRIERYWFMFSV